MGPRNRRARRRGLVVGAAVASNRASKRQAAAQQDEIAAPAPAPAQSDMAAQLEELQGLKNSGVITEEEFNAKKQQILGL